MVIRQIASFSLDRGIIDRDPTRILVKPLAPEGERRELTEPETKAVLSTIAHNQDSLLLALCYYTGTRIGGRLLGFRGRISLFKKTLFISSVISTTK